MHKKTLTTLTLALAASTAAFGQTFVCPNGAGPGQRQVGMTGGSHGIASVPVCVQHGAEAAPSRQQERSPSNAMTDLARSQIGIMNEGLAIVKEGEELEKNPELQKLRKGYWSFSGDKKNPRSGKQCEAFYGSMTGGMIFAGPSDSFNGASMTFLGPNIPRPNSLQKIRVDLTQDADPPRNISAINFVSPDSPNMGRLTFQLASPSEMIKYMEDKYSAKVSIDGKEVINTSYKDGHKAREFLQQCLAGRPPAP